MNLFRWSPRMALYLGGSATQNLHCLRGTHKSNKENIN